MCIGVRLDSRVSSLDQLEVSVDLPGLATRRTPEPPAALTFPVRFAILLPAGTTGAIALSIDGLRAGQPVARAGATVAVTSGATPVALTLVPFRGGEDGGAPDDLASEDLALPDLAHDLALPDLTPPVDLMAYRTITVTQGGDGRGTVSVNGVACPGGCTRIVPLGSTVMLQATAEAGSGFAIWGGACSGMSTSCMFTADGNKTVTASFQRTSYNLVITNVSVSGGTGSLTPTPSVGSCGTGCYTYAKGNNVSITQVPDATMTFLGWGGDSTCRGRNSCTMAMNGDHYVTGSFAAGTVNYAFVTSSGYNIATLSGGTDVLATADGLCQARATAAQVPDASSFKAWLSLSTTNAVTRFGSARGWVRVDGLPFTDQLTGTPSLTTGQIFYPLLLDEQGFESSRSAFTGTNAQGQYSGSNCANYTQTGVSGTSGNPRAGADLWTADFLGNCNLSFALYCFGTASTAPLTYTATGRRAFVSSTAFIGAVTVAAMDVRCGQDATAASLPGTYRAFVATAATPALGRFDTLLAPWQRADGTLLSQDATTFDPSGARQLAPLNQTAAGVYVKTADLAWVGSSGASGQSCADWTSVSGSAPMATVNEVLAPSVLGACSESHRFFCLQQ